MDEREDGVVIFVNFDCEELTEFVDIGVELEEPEEGDGACRRPRLGICSFAGGVDVFSAASSSSLKSSCSSSSSSSPSSASVMSASASSDSRVSGVFRVAPLYSAYSSSTFVRLRDSLRSKLAAMVSKQ